VDWRYQGAFAPWYCKTKNPLPAGFLFYWVSLTRFHLARLLAKVGLLIFFVLSSTRIILILTIHFMKKIIIVALIFIFLLALVSTLFCFPQYFNSYIDQINSQLSWSLPHIPNNHLIWV